MSVVRFIRKLIPRYITMRTDAEAYGITQFMEFASGQVKPSDKVLDAGAGSRPYEKYFAHAQYESTDFDDIFDKSSKDKHDFICTLDKIPREDNSYDVVINTQVLEHVEAPQAAVDEFYRILKPGGKLFLTAPQGWGIHGAPYHFFNFTKYGLESLFRKAGFKIEFIKPRGGMFWYVGKRIRTLPGYIYSQHSLKRGGSGGGKSAVLSVLLLPFYLLSIPVCGWFIPLAFFYLDRLDKKQDYTLGYACYCIKEPGSR